MGIEKGREEGREEEKLIGTIQTCRSILGMEELTQEEICSMSVVEVSTIVSELQAMIRGRKADQ